MIQATPHRESKLRSNASVMFIGNTSYAACQWGLLMVLARLGNAEWVGRFALGLSIASPVILFFNLQLRNLLVSDQTSRHPFSAYLTTRLMSSAASLAVITAIALLMPHSLQAALSVVLIGLFKSIESVSDIYLGLLQKLECFKTIASSLVFKGLSSLVALSGGILLTHDLNGGLALMALAWFGSLLLDRRRALREAIAAGDASPETSGRSVTSVTHLMRSALLLGVAGAFVSLNTNIPRYMIEHTFDAKALGYFSAIAYTLVAGGTMINAVCQVLAPRMARQTAQGDVRGFRRSLWSGIGASFAIGLSGLVVSTLWGDALLAGLYGADFSHYHTLLNVAMAAGILINLSVPLGYALTATGIIGHQVPLLLFVCATTLATSLLFVEKFALAGGFLALATGALVQVLCSGWLLFSTTPRQARVS